MEQNSYPPTAESLMAVLRQLRAPGGCPWDRKQTRQTFSRCLSSECAELLDAIDRNDIPNIREELGDVLMNIFFQVIIGEENGEFDLKDVLQEIIDKMIRRHAHVFGDKHADTPEDVLALWQQIKEREHDNKPASIMDKVPLNLGALERADEIQSRAAKVGFDWPDTAGAVAKLQEEMSELNKALSEQDDQAVAEELGDVLFSAVNLARLRKKESAEEILRQANRKFIKRFQQVEYEVRKSGKEWQEFTLPELDEIWNRIKHQ